MDVQKAIENQLRFERNKLADENRERREIMGTIIEIIRMVYREDVEKYLDGIHEDLRRVLEWESVPLKE